LAQAFDLPARHAIDLTPTLKPMASQVAPPLLAPPAPPPAQAQVAPAPRWWTWAAFGGSAAFLLGSGALELSRRSLEKEAGRADTQPDADQKYDAMLGRQTAARVTLGVGLALGAVGGVSLYLDLQRRGRGETAVGLACAGGECQALARGHW
jgi:hypothetical protein